METFINQPCEIDNHENIHNENDGPGTICKVQSNKHIRSYWRLPLKLVSDTHCRASNEKEEEMMKVWVGLSCVRLKKQ